MRLLVFEFFSGHCVRRPSRKRYTSCFAVQASPLADRIVFNKVKQRLGGKVELIVSGGAPLAPHVEEFLKVAMCAPVAQGYGLTETCAASFIAVPDDVEVCDKTMHLDWTLGRRLMCASVYSFVDVFFFGGKSV